MKKWQYMFHKAETHDKCFLDQLGSAGWEMVGLVYAEGTILAWLKKEIEQKPRAVLRETKG